MDLQEENELEVQQPKYQLNQGQQAAYDYLIPFGRGKSTFRKVLLTGFAGTGKTFLINRVVEALRQIGNVNIGMTAPTHKAVRVMKKMSEFKKVLDFGTIHSFLGLKEHIDDQGKVTYKPDFVPGRIRKIDNIDILIVDESSMLQDDLYEHIETEMRSNTHLRLILLGDVKQICPVREKDDPAKHRDAIPFIPEYRHSYKIDLLELTEPQRQSLENPILMYAKAIRENERMGAVPFSFLDKYKDHLEEIPRERVALFSLFKKYFKTPEFEADPDFVKVVAYRNDTVKYFNEQIRLLMHDAETLPKILVGDKLIMDKPVVRGTGSSKTIVLSNNEEIEVTAVRETNLVLGYKLYKTNSFFDQNQTSNDDQNFVTKSIDCKIYSLKVLDSEHEVHSIDILHEESEAIFQSMMKEVESCANKVRDTYHKKEMWRQFYGLQEKVAWTKYNYAVTAHKSQGSSYVNTFSMEWDIDTHKDYRERNRIRYVAATRSMKKLFVIR